MSSLHWLRMVACAAARFPLRIWLRLMYSCTSLAKIISVVLLKFAPGSSSIGTVSGSMSSANKLARSLHYFRVFSAYPSRAATVFAYCLRSVFSLKHSNTLPFISAVSRLKPVVPRLFLGCPRPCPRPPQFLLCLPPRPLPLGRLPPVLPEPLLLVDGSGVTLLLLMFIVSLFGRSFFSML